MRNAKQPPSLQTSVSTDTFSFKHELVVTKNDDKTVLKQHRATATSTSHSHARFVKLLTCGGIVPLTLNRLTSRLQVARRPVHTSTRCSRAF